LRTITVTGEGRVTATPDVAHVSIGVRVAGSAAQAVLAAANERASSLIEALRAAGLTEADLANSAEVYEANNTLTVTVRDIERSGEIIDLAASVAGEHVAIHGISFGVTDPEAAIGPARVAAIANARARAAEYATAAGVTVGDLVAITENSFGGGPAPFVREARVASAGGVPLETGTTVLTAAVTVVFEIA
jgi:uncharacterized protein YggE